MFLITNLSNKPKQQITVRVNDYEEITFFLEYKPNQLGWFFGFTYNNIEYNNIRLTTSYNILRAYRNWLPFGLRCDTADGEEPMDIDDFSNKYALIYVLNKNEFDIIESNYYAKD